LSGRNNANVARLKRRLLVRNFSFLQKVLEQALVYCRCSLQFMHSDGIVITQFTLPGRLTHGLFHCIEARLRQRVVAPHRLRHALRFSGNAALDIPLFRFNVHDRWVASVIA